MTTLTIQVNERNISGKRFLSFLDALDFVSIIRKENKSGIDKSIEDKKSGRVYSAKNAKDLMSQLMK